MSENLNPEQLGNLILGMRSAYKKGDNVMAYAREKLKSEKFSEINTTLSTLISYDLQAGTYVELACQNFFNKQQWCRQIADLISPVLPTNGSLLEVGVGEATTLAGVLEALHGKTGKALGFDISWSRIAVGNAWLQAQDQQADLFVADLLHIPLADNSVDLVYSSHSLEPNGGQEMILLAECLRVARHFVVLVEPLYELASNEAKERMRHHGYIRGLKETAERLGADIINYRLLDYCSNPLNPSGVLLLQKSSQLTIEKNYTDGDSISFKCPLTGALLKPGLDFFFAPDVGIAYPVLKGVPLLRPEHAVIASKLQDIK